MELKRRSSANWDVLQFHIDQPNQTKPTQTTIQNYAHTQTQTHLRTHNTHQLQNRLNQLNDARTLPYILFDWVIVMGY